jgi:hypothetical protein
MTPSPRSRRPPPSINYFDIKHFADNMKKLNEYIRFNREAFKQPDSKGTPLQEK